MNPRILPSFITLCLLLSAPLHAAPIDRHALVTRHDVQLHQFDVNNPLSVGNGEFCFTVDATGLQTFPEAFAETTPLGTLSDWGWHTIPNTNGWSIDAFQFKEFPDLNGRPVPYCDAPGNNKTPESQWLRANPHRLHLGQIGFVLKHADGSPAQTNDLTDISQTLDLWNGEITSFFKFDGLPVELLYLQGKLVAAVAAGHAAWVDAGNKVRDLNLLSKPFKLEEVLRLIRTVARQTSSRWITQLGESMPVVDQP